jgi:hypothetical protein
MTKTMRNFLTVSVMVVTVLPVGIIFTGCRANPVNQCEARPTSTGNLFPDDPNVMPGGRPEDAALAQTDPDEYAWKLFLAINRQALSGKRGQPDPNKPNIRQYDDDMPVIWETWALSSGGRTGKKPLPQKNTSEVFKDLGQKPDPWDQLPADQKSFEHFSSKQMSGVTELADSALKADLNRKGLSTREVDNVLERTSVEKFIQPDFIEESEGIGEEVRMNKATFEHVVANNLYNIEGLEEAFRKFRDSPDPANPVKIDLPATSQEIKALWVRIREEDKPRYHWRTLRKGSEVQIWGLTALHVTTKDLQDWFWSDFEHVDYLELPVHSVNRNLGARIIDRGEIPSRDTTTRGTKPCHAAQDCNGYIQGLREETIGTKWAFYRLRGTQTTFTCFDFITCKEVPTILANTQIEQRFQQTSSCITCHSRATIGERADPQNNFFPKQLDVFLSTMFLGPSNSPGLVLVGPVGKKQDDWFLEQGKIAYAQTDFMWIFATRALSTKVAKPNRTPPPRCDTPCPVPSPAASPQQSP